MKHVLTAIRFRASFASLVLMGAFATTGVARADEEARIESILERAAGSDGASRVALARELAELGTGADPLLFAALAAECAAAPAGASASARGGVLLAAFDWMGGARWRPLLARELGEGTEPGAIAAIIAISGHSGHAGDLAFLLQAGGSEAGHDQRTQLERAVTRILVRDAAAFDALEGAVGTVGAELRSAMIHAVEATRLPRAALLLARWIETRREMRFECLPYLSRLSLSLEKPLPPEVTTPVRRLVEEGDETTLREAVLCSGRLGDCEVLPALIRHLREGEYGLRAEALWALQSISGMNLAADPVPWENWLAMETRWWNEESRTVFSWLGRGTKAEKVEALRQISLLRTWRHQAAAEVVVALEDTDEEVAVLAAALLGRLGSRVAVLSLVDVLGGERPKVASAAHAALVSITKRDLPTDPVACREAVLPAR